MKMCSPAGGGQGIGPDSGEVQGPIVSTRLPVARGLLGDHVQ